MSYIIERVYRRIIPALVTVAALSACAKTEVIPAAVESEVSFSVAPLTRDGSSTLKSLNDDSWIVYKAYYLGPGFNNSTGKWEEKAGSSLEYNPDNGGYPFIKRSSDGTWHSTVKLYWPTDAGTLSFYAWTLNISGNEPSYKWNRPEIYKTTGVSWTHDILDVDSGDSHIGTNGFDFMVADPAVDKTKNEHIYNVDGVPLLFRHMLTMLRITARTSDDYSEAKEFYIRSIKLTDMLQKASFQQCSWDESASPKWSVVNRWTPVTDETSGNPKVCDVDFYKYSGTEDSKTAAGLKVESHDDSAPTDVTANISYYNPQDFTGEETVELTYQIKNLTNNVVENITKTMALKDIVGDKFELGHRYTINLIFGLDEILWDPAIDDWTPEEKTVEIKN